MATIQDKRYVVVEERHDAEAVLRVTKLDSDPAQVSLRCNPLQGCSMLIRKYQILPPAEDLPTPGEVLSRLKDRSREFAKVNGVVRVLTQ